MTLKKRFLKSRPVCKVTFNLPEETAGWADTAYVVGDFNQWATTATPMRKVTKGGFTVTVDLEVGQECQFRYLLDGTTWVNDEAADKYVSSEYPGVENSVVVV